MFVFTGSKEEASAHMLRAAETAARMVDESANYPVDVPEGQKGKWLIRKFELSHHGIAFNNLKFAVDGFPEMVASPGHYTSLSYKDERDEWVTMMSDTQFEYRTNKDFVDATHGDVLIAGLGLGMLIGPLAAKPEVRSITVVEIDQDVIDLVAPTYRYIDKLKIVKQDIFNYEPVGRYYDVAMFDIWPTTSSANLRQMKKLEAKWKWSNGQQFFWARDICERMKQREKELMTLAKEVRNARRTATET